MVGFLTKTSQAMDYFGRKHFIVHINFTDHLRFFTLHVWDISNVFAAECARTYGSSIIGGQWQSVDSILRLNFSHIYSQLFGQSMLI